MAEQRVTVTLEGEALEPVKQIAGPRGVSAMSAPRAATPR